MSVSRLRERMMCPRYGNRRVNLIFEPPAVAKAVLGHEPSCRSS